MAFPPKCEVDRRDLFGLVGGIVGEAMFASRGRHAAFGGLQISSTER
jgi:hypothetical protein